MKSSLIWPAMLTILFAACGGGGGGGDSSPTPSSPVPTPTVLSGQFKDANVAGLAYSTPTRSGTTDTRGTFMYVAGETVEFSIGGVVIGSAAGQGIVTPLDLVPGGGADTPEIQNIVRFLMMLDQDGDPADGIAVSTNVQQVAENWLQIDFSASDFDAEVVTIVSDVASVDSRPAALPGSAAAVSHISGSMHCVMSGFFRGTYTGAVSGVIVFMLNPATGQVVAYHTGAPSNYESVEGISVDPMREFVAPSASGNGDFLEGRLDSLDEVSGTYFIGGATGSFTATRRLPDPTAAYRFSGRYYRNDTGTTLSGPLVLNVDDQGVLRAEGYDLNLGNTFSANGTFIDNEFEYDYGDGQRQYGTADSSLYVAGSGSTVNGNPRPWFAQGCRLN